MDATPASFEELLGPGQATDEAEIDRLVESAKTRLYKRRLRKG